MKKNFYRKKALIFIAVIVVIIFTMLFFVFQNINSEISINAYKKVENSSHLLYVSGVDMSTVKPSDIKKVTIGFTFSKNRIMRKHVKVSSEDLDNFILNNPNIKLLGDGSLEYPYELQYDREVTFYAPKLKKDDITKLFENFKVCVTWEDIFGKECSKTFYLKDCKWN
ncbi:hypothetical protein [Inconstantimicrobium mannanitabidum]|uniref:Uncharacterized protein n=1 Tax=Inconstantimicrobium mannanitabidum TaxID=1604901 RepID=A0ACB5RIS6_9CLOT|nr:hypothetical protein [Clostridium sp. TW13]GKX68979.1 hypothetical protein rsdtw13_42370 [Clostridium sp. TW13]